MSDAKATNTTDSTIDSAAMLTDAVGYKGLERRSRLRQQYDCELTLMLLANELSPIQKVSVRARDISTSGLGVVARGMVHLGWEGCVVLTRSDGRRVTVGIRVARCEYSGDMTHVIGLQFIPVPQAIIARGIDNQSWTSGVEQQAKPPPQA
jgi:PilZ domain